MIISQHEDGVVARASFTNLRVVKLFQVIWLEVMDSRSESLRDHCPTSGREAVKTALDGEVIVVGLGKPKEFLLDVDLGCVAAAMTSDTFVSNNANPLLQWLCRCGYLYSIIAVESKAIFNIQFWGGFHRHADFCVESTLQLEKRNQASPWLAGLKW